MTPQFLNKLLFFVHIVIAQGGFLYLSFYRYQNILNTCKRIFILFGLWIISNILCNGCPLTHVENWITFWLFGYWPMPNYNFFQSWVYQILFL